MTQRKTSPRKTPSRKTSAKTSAPAKDDRTSPKKAAERGKTASHKSVARKTSPRNWSASVTEHSDAMDLQEGVFRNRNPGKIALSLKHSAEKSDRRKAGAFRSAMSMLTFYINRAGHNLSATRRKTLDAAKGKLRAVFGKKARKR